MQNKFNLISKVILGLVAGIINGLFAAGGGMIILPALVHFFRMEDNKARATTIFAILPVVIASGFFYYKNNYMDFELGIKCAIGGIIGGYIGSKLLKVLSKKTLRILFIMFLIYASTRMIF